MKECETYPPIVITEANGLYLTDIDGNQYLDTISSWWCNVLGHNHPKVISAMKGQLDQFDHVMFGGFTHKPAIKLSEKIVKITPDKLTRVFYSDNGSTAIEVALKMSLQYWQHQGAPQKKQFVYIENGYHGDTIGAMSVSGVSLFNQIFSPLLFKAHQIPCPVDFNLENPNSAEATSLEGLEACFKKSHESIAAMVIEPLVMGAGGMRVTTESYVKEVRRLTARYNVQLICDEIAVGFGRTGDMFVSTSLEIEPDYLCLSKGLTNGTLPLAATLTTDHIYDTFYGDTDEQKTFYHGHTFTANGLACAAANATLDIFHNEQVLDQARPVMDYFKEKLQTLESIEGIKHIRAKGFIGAFNLDQQVFDCTPMQLYQEGLDQGILLRPLGEVVYLYLPLSTSKSQINTILEKTTRSIRCIYSAYRT